MFWPSDFSMIRYDAYNSIIYHISQLVGVELYKRGRSTITDLQRVTSLSIPQIRRILFTLIQLNMVTFAEQLEKQSDSQARVMVFYELDMISVQMIVRYPRFIQLVHQLHGDKVTRL